MEDVILQDKPGLFTRIGGLFTREIDEEYDEPAPENRTNGKTVTRGSHRNTVTIRRQISNFDDAMAAAVGLKRGEQQILNLVGTDPAMRQKIVDFMCGVNFAQEGTWEEIGENIYIVAPASTYIEVAPATPRQNAAKN
jgi:cell division inhibitor SepF